ncbi:MAG: RIP metalloprotease RseP [Magnetococcales bacterium]|nr:RIP metalloprotease RseP [Magnetococcales bacterium]
MFHTVFWAIIVLGVLIFVHELGHFLLARFHGVRVQVFSLGFGPRLYSWQDKSSGTEYRLSAIPLGGYVKMLGESDEDPIASEDLPHAFYAKKVGPRMMIVFAGPAFNFLFAFVALTGAYLTGVSELLPVVGSVSAGMPAEAAGVQVGDRITYVGDQPVARWVAFSQMIKASEGRVLTLTVERSGEPLLIKVTPQLKETKNLFGESVHLPLIGVGPGSAVETVAYAPLDAMAKGWEQTWSMTLLTLTSTWKLITQVVSADQIGGPLMIADLAGKAAEQGASNLLFFMALISVNLAILNLLPVPILDGGHLMFFSIEALRGQPVGEAVQQLANRVGMALLLLLMLWALKNDLTRFFPMSH